MYEGHGEHPRVRLSLERRGETGEKCCHPAQPWRVDGEMSFLDVAMVPLPSRAVRAAAARPRRKMGRRPCAFGRKRTSAGGRAPGGRAAAWEAHRSTNACNGQDDRHSALPRLAELPTVEAAHGPGRGSPWSGLAWPLSSARSCRV